MRPITYLSEDRKAYIVVRICVDDWIEAMTAPKSEWISLDIEHKTLSACLRELVHRMKVWNSNLVVRVILFYSIRFPVCHRRKERKRQKQANFSSITSSSINEVDQIHDQGIDLVIKVLFKVIVKVLIKSL